MYCPECGKRISDGSKFCQHCGSKISYFSEESKTRKTIDSDKPLKTVSKSKKRAIDSDRSLKTDRKTWLTILLIVLIGVVLMLFITAKPQEKTFGNTDAFAMAKDIVRAELSSPISSVFCKYYQATITHESTSDLWTVKGWVDSKDTKGAYFRQHFTAVFHPVKDSQGYYVYDRSSVKLN